MDIERSLLFAVLALRETPPDLPALTAACRAWAARPDAPLAEALVNHGLLTPEDRARVEELVRRQLETPTVGSVAGLPLPPPVTTAELPARVGRLFDPAAPEAGAATESRYQRLSLHGAGGIGQVWLARDTELGRDVALKQLRPETAQDAASRARFLEEARVTGQLEHPNIVPVHDLVRPADGSQPYYIMRFVKGRTLSAAVAAYHDNPQAGRIELLGLMNAFLAVCNALAFAHSRGVLHRDLKGQNVILGEFGEVNVLDWGLARRMGDRETANALVPAADGPGPTPTLPGQVLGTPGYMAPEQAAGRTDEIDARTDVYGLGAILYEVLTGRPPFSTAVGTGTGIVTALDLPALLRRIQTESPRPPRQVRPAAPPALEAICLKALSRRREDRYQSAAELARDVQRWLADEPVSVYREPLAARLGRWSRRHRLAVTSLAVLLVCAVLGLTVSTILVNAERQRTEEARLRAEQNYATARAAVKQFFVQVSEERLLNEPGLQPLRQELLRTANNFFAKLAAAEDDPGLRADHGRALLALAEVSQNLGQTEAALERVRQAEVIFTALRDRQPEEPEHRHELGRCHLRRGNFLYLAQGPVPKAAAEWNRARPELHAAGPTEAVRRDLAFCANSLGSYYNRQALQAGPERRAELFAASAREYDKARRGWEALLRDHPASGEYQSHLAGLYQNLGVLHHQAGREQQGHEAILECVRLRADLLRRAPHNLEYQSNLGTAYTNLGLSLRALRQPAAAATAYEQALALLRPVAEKNAAVTRYQFELAGVYYSRSMLRQERLPPPSDRGYRPAWEAALEDMRRARDIYDDLYRKFPREKKFEASAATVLANLGDLWYLVDRREAVTWYDRAVPWLERLATDPTAPGYVSAGLASACWGRAEGLGERGDYAGAVANWDRYFSLRSPPAGSPQRLLRAKSRLGLATVLARRRDHAGAVAELEKLTAEEALPAGIWWKAGQLLGYCAEVALEGGRQSLAERWAAAAVRLLRRAREAGYPER